MKGIAVGSHDTQNKVQSLVSIPFARNPTSEEVREPKVPLEAISHHKL